MMDYIIMIISGYDTKYQVHKKYDVPVHTYRTIHKDIIRVFETN